MKTEIEAIFSKRDALKLMLPSLTSDEALTLVLTDFLNNNKKTNGVVANHEEFVLGLQKSIIPKGDRKNYNPKLLKELRQKAGLTQVQVEKKLGKKLTWLSQYETGKARKIDSFEKGLLLEIYNGN